MTHVSPVVLLTPARNALTSMASTPRWMSVPSIVHVLRSDFSLSRGSRKRRSTRMCKYKDSERLALIESEYRGSCLEKRRVRLWDVWTKRKLKVAGVVHEQKEAEEERQRRPTCAC